MARWRKHARALFLAEKRSARAACVYSVFVLIWHAVVFQAGFALSNWIHRIRYGQIAGYDAQYESKADELMSLVAGRGAVLLGEGLLAWLIFRIRFRRDDPSVIDFARLWWRNCLAGTLLIPVLLVSSQQIYPLSLVLLAIPLYLTIGPSQRAVREARPYRRSRWRPVCPECGYSVFRIRSNRCPECGARYPTTRRTFRRWAALRIAWDRRERGGLIGAYVRTLALILLAPCRAGARLAMPDRLGRAVRWATFHGAITVLFCTLSGSTQFYVHWWISGSLPTFSMWWGGAAPTAFRYSLWLMQSAVAWSVVIASIPAMAILLSTLAPGRRPAAKRGLVKWSLYSTAVLLPAAVVSLIVVEASGRTSFFGGMPPTGIARFGLHVTVRPSISVMFCAYAVVWSIGAPFQPYLNHRGWAWAFTLMLTFVCMGGALAWLVFPATAFVDLL